MCPPLWYLDFRASPLVRAKRSHYSMSLDLFFGEVTPHLTWLRVARVPDFGSGRFNE